jgi:hypothetical protein
MFWYACSSAITLSLRKIKALTGEGLPEPMSYKPYRFFFAKIGRSNGYANVYLTGQGEIGRPAIPIYFDCSFTTERDFLDSNCALEQGVWFFECGREPDGKIIVVAHENTVWLLRPSGRVEFVKSTVGYKEEGGFVKLLPVELAKRIPLADVPHILASIGANRYYSSGCFREISSIGNIRAIQSVLGLEISQPTVPGAQAALECLSSVELETLVARLFEEAGLFVPAYRGGMMPGADLFAYNRSTVAVVLGGLTVEAGCRRSIQVKLKTGARKPPPGVDMMVCCEAIEAPGVLGIDWLAAALASSPTTLHWLRQSLDWLPQGFLASTLEAEWRKP